MLWFSFSQRYNKDNYATLPAYDSTKLTEEDEKRPRETPISLPQEESSDISDAKANSSQLNESSASILAKWSPNDVDKFKRGLQLHGKHFENIRRAYFADKTTADLVSFFYAWKRSGKEVKGKHPSRVHQFLNPRTDKQKKKSAVIGSVEAKGMVTRRRSPRSTNDVESPMSANPNECVQSKLLASGPQFRQFYIAI